MRILMTGAAGFIGSHLFTRLASQGIAVAGLVRSSRLEQLQKIAAPFPNATVLSCDDPNSLPETVAAFNPTACVHLAGRSSVRESLQNPGLYEEANCRFSIALLEALRHCNCARLVHASTVMIYGKDAPLPYSENAIGSTPSSFYGASKLAIETQMNTWRALHKMETFNLRLFSVYGRGLRPDCVPHLIASAILSGKEFTLLGDGSSVRDYIAVEDVLSALEAALNLKWREGLPLAINIGSGTGTTLLELIRMMERGLSQPAKLIYKPAVAGELPAVVANIQTAQRVLNWRPAVNIYDGMTQLSEWFLKGN